jgi:glutamyl-tRNA synthetase
MTAAGGTGSPGPEQVGKPFAIRIKAPLEGETIVQDLVQGEVRVANSELDDMIILRSDGTPTYLHAVVVDDHDMRITHVIRGDDHLTNTFRQCMVYDAMGWHRPYFAHMPLIHGADGAKLSKRHGAVSVLDFREQGFLPDAVGNYLLRLGWGHGDEEFIPRDRAVTLFDIKDVGRAASRMDYAKLTHLNGQYLRMADDDALTRDVLERLAKRTVLFGTRWRQACADADAVPQGKGEDAGRTDWGSGLCGAGWPARYGSQGRGFADARSKSAPC